MSKNSLLQKDILVTDTSSLVTFPDLINTVRDYNIFIPIEVLEELDKLKTYKDHTGVAARQVNRHLDALRKRSSIFKGVPTENDSVVFVICNSDLKCLPETLKDNVDNRIISVAYQAQETFGNVMLTSEDIALRVKCDSLGIDCCNVEDLIGGRNDDISYSGVSTLEVTEEIIDTFFAEGEIDPSDFDLQEVYHPNEFVVLKAGQQSAILRVWSDGIWRKLHYAGTTKKFKVQNIRPRNKEQSLSLELLLDPGVSMVTLTGMAGCGKTLLAIAAALTELQAKHYDKIIISRPAESTSKEIGFLPGTKEEKMMPWLQPIMDNLKVLLGKNGQGYVSMMFDKGQIEVEALSYIRGRSLLKTYFIIDEAQNINIKEAKALITRMGKGSKIVLLGDLEQIDSTRLVKSTSGLGVVVDRFKEFEGSGHVTLTKGERSKLATYAAEVM